MSARAFKALVLGYVDVVRAAVKHAASERSLLKWERYVDWTKLEAMMREKATALYAETQQRGAKKARAAARRPIRKADIGVTGGIFFGDANPYAVDWAATRSSDFITMIDNSVREAVRNYVSGAIRDGTPIDALARQLDGIVGLRPDQVDTIEKMRAQLLTEGRTQSEIDRLIAARSSRMVTQRATMIARTETNAAQNAGALNEWAQQKAAGDMADTAVREWIAGQENQCPICASLDGKHATIGGTFHSDFSGAEYVAPPAHPGCKCSQGIAVLSEKEFARV